MARIGLVCDAYPPISAAGGIGTYARCAGRAAAHLGHEVHIFHLPLWAVASPHVVPLVDGPLRVHSAPGCRDPGDAARRLPGWIAAVAARYGPFDFVECPEYGAYGLFLERGRFLRNWGVRLHTSTRLVQIQNGANDEEVTAIDRAEREACLRAPLLSAPSCAIVQETRRIWGIDPRQVARIPNPAVVPDQEEPAAPAGPEILFWGRFSRLKGVDRIADAFTAVRREVPDVKFTFVGPDARWRSGEMGTEMIRRRQQEQGLPAAAVRLAPALPHAILRRAIARCAVAVLPSRFENYPYALLEAMALGRPVVSCAVGGIPEIVQHGVTGLLADPDDPGGLAACILEVLKDPEGAAHMGAEARRWVAASCDPREIARALLAHWGIEPWLQGSDGPTCETPAAEGDEGGWLKVEGSRLKVGGRQPVVEVLTITHQPPPSTLNLQPSTIPPPPLLSRVLPGRMERADLSAQVTAFVATVGDTVNFEECLAKLRAQSVTCRIEVIDRIAPMSAAFQAMLDRCTTEYYVQVDEDMLLFPGALATLFDALRRAPPEVAIVCAPLWDVDTERSIYGVKIYRHAIVARYPYADCFSCEMEQVHRFEADGYRIAYLPLVEQGGTALGEHGKHYTPRTAFLRWKRVVQKQRRYGWMGWIEPYHQRNLERWRNSNDPVHLAAVLGMVAGLVGELPADAEADFRESDPDWERIRERYFPECHECGPVQEARQKERRG